MDARAEENQLLRDMIRRFAADTTGPAAWRDLVELGVPGAGVPESLGGFGGGAEAVAIVLEEAEAARLRSPLLEVMGMTLPLYLALRREDLVAAVVEGRTLDVVGGDAFTVGSGTKGAGLVPEGAGADGIVLAKGGSSGTTLVRIGGGAEARRLLDGSRAAIVPSEATEGEVLAHGPEADRALSEATAHALVANVAAMLGAARALHDATLDYIKTREQFGQRIGSFQVVQHRMVDMHIALHEAGAMLDMALDALGKAPGAERDARLSSAKAGVGARALRIAKEAIQLHGGIGMTDELPLGHLLRRIRRLSLTHGSEWAHLDRVAAA